MSRQTKREMPPPPHQTGSVPAYQIGIGSAPATAIQVPTSVPAVLSGGSTIPNTGGQSDGEDIMDSMDNYNKDSENEDGTQGWQQSKSKKARKKIPPIKVAVRASSRIPRDGIPIADKASSRATMKNDISCSSWAIWSARNKMAIEKQFPKAPSDVIYNALSLMQKWSVDLKWEDQERLTVVKNKLVEKLKTFTPSSILASDVVEWH